MRSNRLHAAAALVLWLPATLAAQSRRADGQRIFINNCAACHRQNSGTRAPLPEVLAQMPREAIVRALETGLMKQQGSALTAEQKQTVAEFLARARPTEPITKGFCPAIAAPSDHPTASRWNGWGAALNNARFQPADGMALLAIKSQS